MEQYRGFGHTELVIINLPTEPCTVIVPSREIGNEIDKRIADVRPKGTWRTIVITNHADVQKMAGLSEPVFFDHSFFICGTKNPRAVKEAMDVAIVSSRMAKWKAEAVEPNTDAKTAKEQPIAAANERDRLTEGLLAAVPGTREYGILLGHAARMCGGYARAVDCGIMTPDDVRFANGLPPLSKTA